ncbi:unnamed protein product [Cylindrotheca closterium]|uniref:Uncharacterized protein n=1 Tax=Cylindrotheca closterium TaxID=2856 RepID=A0AAD2G9S2_9STRA|nr:unnamed protein product [Cylindrotheca closterium]
MPRHSPLIGMSEVLVPAVPGDKDFLNHLEGNGDNCKFADNEEIVNAFSKQIPPNASDPKCVDSLIANQMTKLSVADREKACMGVHGMPKLVEETPELI